MIRMPCVLCCLIFLTLAASETSVTAPDGTRLQVIRVAATAKAPVGLRRDLIPSILLLPGGMGESAESQSAVQLLGKPLAALGFSVAVPVAPHGDPFRKSARTAALVVAEQLRTDAGRPNDRLLIAGISNGGNVAIEFLAERRDLFAACIATPGTCAFRKQARQPLTDAPVFLRIGANDELGWAAQLGRVEKNLIEAGAIVDAALVPKAPHCFPLPTPAVVAWMKARLVEAPPAKGP